MKNKNHNRRDESRFIAWEEDKYTGLGHSNCTGYGDLDVNGSGYLNCTGYPRNLDHDNYTGYGDSSGFDQFMADRHYYWGKN